MQQPTENKPNGNGAIRIINAINCSYKGIKAAYCHEAAFRQELLLVALLTPVAIFTSESASQFVGLFAVLILVLIIELINSAIEAAIDRISLSHHILAGRAKDMGSAAVTLSLLVAAMVWLAHLYEVIFTSSN